MGLYDRYLATRIRLAEESLPDTVALIITERDLLEDGAYDTLEAFLDWAFGFGADRVVVYVSVGNEDVISTLRRELERIDAPHPISVRSPDDESRATTPVQVSIGLGGKHEFAAAVRGIATAVENGQLDPGEITGEEIERRLVFPSDPDLIIKTGAERLSDFMIWQSVYSELYFTDVNWRNFRRRDYLRALQDFQRRQRRFGR
ncbi:undecaprenyl diphosphate synthase family protein [Halovenus sp. HT40]|uniref:undecaprenyl diphosphate synthase family protein n=1 Tax=Halovenus sp. HT40 TaxID=3126691 RepID=UPI00300E9278